MFKINGFQSSKQSSPQLFASIDNNTVFQKIFCKSLASFLVFFGIKNCHVKMILDQLQLDYSVLHQREIVAANS